MTKAKKKAMILELVQAMDYDTYKYLAYPEESEDQDASIDLMSELIEIVGRYVE